MPPVITVENLEFSYGTAPVLRGLDLSVEAGEVVCLLGPNGVGKTTLVENLLGSLTPTSGGVRVLGTDPRRAGADFWARIGLVQQNWTDHPKWRVKDQLEWIRSVQLTAASRVIGVDEVLDAVGLADKADSRLSRLSGGQRRTVDFAAALMAAPELLVLDEPTTGLDPNARAAFWATMRAQTAAGRSILFATHYLQEAADFADRIVIIDRGRLVASGSVDEVRAMGEGTTVSATWRGLTGPAELRAALAPVSDSLLAVAVHGEHMEVRTTAKCCVPSWLV